MENELSSSADPPEAPDEALPVYPASLGRTLNFATGAMNRLCQAMLAEHDLTLQKWVILSALWGRDGLKVNDLARYNGSNPPAASRLVDRMVDAGLVRRRADRDDARAVRVYLTAKGARLRRLDGFPADVNERLLDGFSAREAAALHAMLERVQANADVGLQALGGGEKR